MREIHIICVGKLKEKFYQDACAEYMKRLGGYCRLTVTEIPETKLPKDPFQAQIDDALAKEAQKIRDKLPPRAYMAALCIEGRLYSSRDMAGLVVDTGAWVSLTPRLCFLIGGAYGLDERLKAEAQVRLSMSPMTFPHHLARVMLLEQIYRAFKIRQGSAYHK